MTSCETSSRKSPATCTTKQIVQMLADLSLVSGAGSVADNLISCYEAMVAKSFIPPEELPLVKAWVSDMDSLR